MSQNPPVQQSEADPCDKSNKAPTSFTIAKYNAVAAEPEFMNTADFLEARNGFIGTRNANGDYTTDQNVYNVRINKTEDINFPIWNLGEYSFLTPPDADKTAPQTVNPSLWRQAKLNMNNGLFEVALRSTSFGPRGIYQVRAFDLSNMTIVETNEGIIVIDPLISTECAKAALELYHHYSPMNLPIKAIIYTHSHIDHYGGVNGVVTENQVGTTSDKIPIYAPSGFLDHAISENAYAGNAMGRRAGYMYGTFLPKDAFGQLDGGLGKGTSIGNTGLIAPTHEIQESYFPHVIDGLEINFLLAEDTEAPAEMLFHFPQYHALCAAEDMTHNLHNLYSIRGSQVRNAMAWWKVINQVIKTFAADTNVVFAQHHWPMWKNTDAENNIVKYLKSQRDLYKYILDQSLRLLNQGRTMVELAEMIKLPKSLSSPWYNRGYYGTLNHDSKAVYQRYMGWYDANPSNLHPHPPVKASRKYVEYMGGKEAILGKAQTDYTQGDYRWVAEVLNHVVFADPESNNPNTKEPIFLKAKCLLADALEQMGYQAESGPWRNAYLNGAWELRNGISHKVPTTAPLHRSVVNAMSLDQYFDYMGLRFNAPNAEAANLPPATINWTIFRESGGSTVNASYYQMELMNYTLPYTSYEEGQMPPAPIQVFIDRHYLNDLAINENPRQKFLDGVAENRIEVVPKGAVTQVANIFGMLDVFPANFNIVTPIPDQPAS